MKHAFEIEEGDRQAIILALAKLSLTRPGWYEACLKRIANELGGVEMFEEFRRHGHDPRQILGEDLPPPPVAGMKWLVEVQRAYDLLHPIVTREVPVPLDEDARQSARLALDVLCWVLEHSHNESFSTSLASLEAFARRHGFVLREGKPE